MLTAFRRGMPLARRAEAIELLDGDGLSPREVERNLADLAHLNRLPGGVRASLDGLRRLLDGADDVHVLDAGTGRSDMPLAFARRGWRTTAVDVHPEVLRIARRTTADEPRVTVMKADVRTLPFDDGSFDVSHSSLLAHHLDPDDLVTAFSELGRVARRGVVVNDLRRGLLPLLATAATVAMPGTSRVTRADGIASARRAYTLPELDALLARAGLRVRWRSPRWMPRVVTVASRER